MNSGQESKIPFIILLPFVAIVFALSLRSGVPATPSMPGVTTPVAPTILAPVIEAVAPAAAEVVPAESVAPTADAPSEENWE